MLASVLNNPTDFDPANGKDAQGGAQGALRLRPRRHGRDRRPSPPRRPTRPPSGCRSSPRSRPRASTAARSGHMLDAGQATSCTRSASPTSEIDGGGLRVTTTFTPKAMDGGRGGRAGGSGPRASATSSCTSASRRSSPAPARCAASTAARTTSSPRSTGPSPAAWSARRSSRSPLATAHRARASPSRTPSRATRPTSSPTGSRSATRAPATAPTTASAVDRDLRRPRSRSTPPSSTCRLACPTARTRSSKTANELGIPPAKADQEVPRHPRRRAATSRPTPLITLGKARISPINMANAYATIANGGQRADVHVDREGRRPQRRDRSTSYEVASTEQALDEDIAADVSYAISRSSQNGTGRPRWRSAARPPARPAPPPTTTDEVSSSWFVGYTPQLSTAVMYVRGDGDDQLDGWLPSLLRRATTPPRPGPRSCSATWRACDVEEFPPPANVDGEAPDDGHDAYTPPPPPTTAAARRPRPPSDDRRRRRRPRRRRRRPPSARRPTTPTPTPTPTATADRRRTPPTPTPPAPPTPAPTAPRPRRGRRGAAPSRPRRRRAG